MLARSLERALRAAPWLLAGGVLVWYAAISAPSIHSPDWLDDVGLFVVGLGHGIGRGIWDWLIVPCASFVTKHWLALSVPAVIALLIGRLSEWHAIVIHYATAAINDAEESFRQQTVARAKRREEARFLGMSEDAFKRLVARKSAEKERHENRVRILAAEMRRCEVGIGLKYDILRKRARKHDAAAKAVGEEIRRLLDLWQKLDHIRMRRNVLNLMDQLNAPYEADAKEALAQLNALWRVFDWNRLVPRKMSDADRVRMSRLLQIMASTTQLGEARNAREMIRQMMDSYNMDWRREAA